MAAINTRELKKDLQVIRDIADLTEVFENMASIKIRAVRQQVLSSKVFFNDLWGLYKQLRVDDNESIVHGTNHRELLIFISAPAGLAGQNDQNSLNDILRTYNPSKHDIMVIGSHGAQLLKQEHLQPIRAFEVPDITKQFTVRPIIDVIKQYEVTTAYYDSYVSLTTQKAAKLQLMLSAQELSDEEKLLISEGQGEFISPENYIFEPSIHTVIDTLEEVMLNTSVAQLLQESRLAQLANRFISMTTANEKAKEQQRKTFLRLLAAKRYERDEMTRQIATSARMAV